jgi:hypothetical protein
MGAQCAPIFLSVKGARVELQAQRENRVKPRFAGFLRVTVETVKLSSPGHIFIPKESGADTVAQCPSVIAP